jgi:hypothetical protein
MECLGFPARNDTMDTNSKDGLPQGTATAIGILAIAALAVIGIGEGLADNGTGDTGCSALVKADPSLNSVEGVSIDAKSGQVTVFSKGITCKEPISTWLKRGHPNQSAQRSAAVGAVAKKVQTKPAKPRKAAKAKPAPVKTAVAIRKPPPDPCNRQLKEFWTAGARRISGRDYWLTKVFTIDKDGVDGVEDVGFRLRSDGGDDLLLHYRAGSHSHSAARVPSLALADETVISRLCFGQLDFATPEADVAMDTKGLAFNGPNLAAEIDAKMNGESEPEKPADQSDDSTSTLAWVGIVGGPPVGLAIGGFCFFLYRRRSANDADDEDDDAEDEDDDAEDEDDD